MKKESLTTVKTTVATGTLKPQPHGGAIRHGGTNKGGRGRPPKAYKEFLADCLDDEIGRAEFLSVIRDSRHPAYSALLAKAMLHVLGAPVRAEPPSPAELTRAPRVHRLMDMLIAEDPVDGPSVIEIPDGYKVNPRWQGDP
jgi:hypothetical protein